jgi:hypothetical protein
MFTSVFLAWTLVVQVQVSLCQEGVCTPHPKLQPKLYVVQTLATEPDCLLLQMDLQRAYQTMPQRHGTRRHVDVQRTFVCQPSH